MNKNVKIFSLITIILGCVIFTAWQMSGNAQETIISSSESDNTKAKKLITTMIETFNKRKWKKFRSCWNKMSKKEIKKNLKQFDDKFPTKFEFLEGIVANNSNEDIIIIGTVNTSSTPYEFIINKKKESYKIKSIKKQM